MNEDSFTWSNYSSCNEVLFLKCMKLWISHSFSEWYYGDKTVLRNHFKYLNFEILLKWFSPQSIHIIFLYSIFIRFLQKKKNIFLSNSVANWIYLWIFAKFIPFLRGFLKKTYSVLKFVTIFLWKNAPKKQYKFQLKSS